MNPNAIRWEVPLLSTVSVEATIRYRDGITAVVAGIPHADRLLTEALGLDPGFLLAQVGLAVARTVDGAPYSPPGSSGARAVTRGERQHAEVVRTALSNEVVRAADLRREHLVEFPGDLLIVWLPVLAVRLGLGPAVR